MRWLLALLIGVIVLSHIMSWPLSLAPGLSAKNAVLYLLLFTLMFRTALRGLPGSEIPAVHTILATWALYATASWLLAALVIRYPNYELIENGITLKAELFDSVLFFLVAFHGLRDARDVKTVLKALAAAMAIASVATLTDVAGLTNLGVVIGRSGAEAGRVFGVFGHANDTAALTNCLLPLSVAVALMARGPARALWFLGAFACFAVLVLTVSRGAYVGFVVGIMWAAWLCRRMISLQRVALWTAGAALASVAALGTASLAMPFVVDVVERRLLGGGHISAAELSSGRTVLWMQVIERMLDKPLTLLTGYGWDVYWVMPFRFVTHNYYLHLWFNLGLVGLGAFIALLVIVVRTALRAAETTATELQPYFIACVFGILMLAVSVFFVNLGGQWDYVWIYAGTMMRAALIALESPVQNAGAVSATAREQLQWQPVQGLARSRPR